MISGVTNMEGLYPSLPVELMRQSNTSLQKKSHLFSSRSNFSRSSMKLMLSQSVPQSAGLIANKATAVEGCEQVQQLYGLGDQHFLNNVYHQHSAVERQRRPYQNDTSPCRQGIAGKIPNIFWNTHLNAQQRPSHKSDMFKNWNKGLNKDMSSLESRNWAVSGGKDHKPVENEANQQSSRSEQLKLEAEIRTIKQEHEQQIQRLTAIISQFKQQNEDYESKASHLLETIEHQKLDIAALQQKNCQIEELETLRQELLNTQIVNSELRAEIDKNSKLEALLVDQKEQTKQLSRKIELMRSAREEIDNGDNISCKYEQEIEYLNNIIHEKNKKIEEITQQNNKLLKRIDEISDNYITQQQLDVLNRCLKSRERQIHEIGGINYDKLNNKTQEYFCRQIFEEKLIYELKNDNIKLIEALHKKQPLKLDIKTSKHHPNFDNLPRNISYEAVSVIKNMSTDLYKKLDRMEKTYQREEQALKGRSKKKEKKSRGKEKGTQQQNRKFLYADTQMELSMLKVHLFNIMGYINELMRQETNDKTRKSAGNSEKMNSSVCSELEKKSGEGPVQALPATHEIMAYNAQCQQRIQQLLQMNSSLKEQLKAKAQPKTNQITEQFWNSQISHLKNHLTMLQSHIIATQTKFEQSTTQIHQLQQSNRQMRHQIDKLHFQLRDKQIQIREANHRLIFLATCEQQKRILREQNEQLQRKNRQFLSQLKDSNAQLYNAQEEKAFEMKKYCRKLSEIGGAAVQLI